MARKHKSNSEHLDDEVIRCYINDHGQEVTTKAERREIAQLFDAGDYEQIVQFATQRRLLPIALIIAGMVEADHPLIVSKGRGIMYSSIGCSTAIIEAMLEPKQTAIPIDLNSIHRQLVERIS